jgi:hypothetical protein
MRHRSRCPYDDSVDTQRFERAIAAIDTANADDPVRIVIDGVERPKELGHAELVTKWVKELYPDPSEELMLAARAHHLRRWTSPRDSYPDGRNGYLRWRRDLKEQQAQGTVDILRGQGYDAATADRVADLIRKKNLSTDAEVQALEDALCLTFLQTQLMDVAARIEAAKLVDILRKTMKKMSPEAIALAGTIDLDPAGAALLEEAATPEGSPA